MEALAKLRNYPTGPRKMRLLADIVRGMEVEKALGYFRTSSAAQCSAVGKIAKECHE